MNDYDVKPPDLTFYGGRGHVLWRTWTYDDEFAFLFLNLTKILKNSTPGKVACI